MGQIRHPPQSLVLSAADLKVLELFSWKKTLLRVNPSLSPALFAPEDDGC